ncbi:MAG: ABC transporter substrate-binding protein [Clostridiales Family XIII bacterium]|jgi:NitT/TauT family transport system substrate-binding protein|nr:ABC transporter substrate-binding protein [Clostridiales Family XIII bacterium]
MKKKVLAAFLTLVLVLGLALAGCGNDDSSSGTDTDSGEAVADDYTVRIAYGSSLCHAALHVAIENGYFEEEGINFEAVPLDSSQTVDGAASGTVDAGAGLIGKFGQPLENGLTIKLVAGLHAGCIKIVTTADSGITSVADLKGKRIGVAALADSPAAVAKRALETAGIDTGAANPEVEFVIFPNADLPAALENGSIDAYAALDPAVSIAARDNGYTIILDTSKDEPFASEYCCAAFVTDKFAEEHPELAAAYTRAVVKAAQWVGEHPEETVKLQLEKQYITGDEELLVELIKDYRFGDADADAVYESLLVNLQELQIIGILKEETDVEALAERAYLKTTE